MVAMRVTLIAGGDKDRRRGGWQSLHPCPSNRLPPSPPLPPGQRDFGQWGSQGTPRPLTPTLTEQPSLCPDL